MLESPGELTQQHHQLLALLAAQPREQPLLAGQQVAQGCVDAVAPGAGEPDQDAAPVARVGAPDVPMPFNDRLERAVIPSAERIVAAVKGLFG